MTEAIVAVILGAAAVIATGSSFVLCRRMWREAVSTRLARRRRALEPLALRYAHGDEASIRDVLQGEPSRLDRAILWDVLLGRIRQVRGIEHVRLARALDDLGLVDAELAALRSRRWRRRADAAERLGLAGATRAVDALAEAVGDGESEVRARAATALGALGGAVAARRLVAALDEPQRWSAIRIADILTEMGRGVVDEVIAGFEALRTPAKLVALDVLGRIRPLRASEWLASRLSDADADVRARAAHALACIGDPRRLDALVGAAADEAWPVRAMACKALGRIRGADAVPALSAGLGDDERWVRHSAAVALRGLGRRGRAALEAALAGDDPAARRQAALSLEEDGVVDARIDELVHVDGERSARAGAFLRRVLDAGRSDRLRTLAREHPDDRVRTALVAVLADEATALTSDPVGIPR